MLVHPDIRAIIKINVSMKLDLLVMSIYGNLTIASVEPNASFLLT